MKSEGTVDIRAQRTRDMRWWLLDGRLAEAEDLVETGMAQLTNMLGIKQDLEG